MGKPEVGTKQDRVKKSTRKYRKRNGFCGPKRKDDDGETSFVNNVNNDTAIVNTGIVNVNNNDTVYTAPPDVQNLNITEDVPATPPPLFSPSVSFSNVQPVEYQTPKEKDNISGYRIIDTEILSVIFSLLLCPQCEQRSLMLGDHICRKQGLSSLLVLKCTNCKFIEEFHTSKTCGRGFDINSRIVYTMRTLGHGYAGIEKFTHLMDMPKPMTLSTYESTNEKVTKAAELVAQETMIDASNELREGTHADEIKDVAVSCDGTWQKRGFQSLNGVFVAISVDNGKILDVEAMNRYCKACCLKEPLKKTDPDTYANWKLSHICKHNYEGSAGSMETEGAKRVFQRSIEKHKLRYTEFLGDGDSKSYLSVKETYPGIEVKKLECVGHYQKRVGTRLRNLKKKEKGLGGRGKLTDAVIDRLQNFFGVAIRQNTGNLQQMKKSVLASLFHVASSNKNNWHFPHCPEGPDSWCKANADKVNGTNLYKPGPGLPLEIVHKVRPIYQALSKDTELEKCLHGKTQNANESFNATIWERVPKTNYVSLRKLEFGVYDAVGHFNIGMKSSILIYEKLNMIPGKFALKGCASINNKRVRRSLYRSDKRQKAKRQALRAKKLKKSDKIDEQEPKTYIPGGF